MAIPSRFPRVRLAVLMVPAAAALAAGPAPAGAKPQVLILGTYHMDNPGLDLVKHEIRDTLGPERQREILALVESLQRFRPTRIAIESDPSRSKRNEELAAYLRGERQLGANEIEQIGFRMAKNLGLRDLCLFDHQGPYPWPEVEAWMKAQGIDVAGSNQRSGERAKAEDQAYTVGQKLALANTDQNLRAGHWAELKHIDAGDPVAGPGPRLVAAWYERNLRMFARLRACPRFDGERLLVIVGAGHAKLLRDFVRDSPDLTFVSPLPYLPKVPPGQQPSPMLLRRYPARLPAAAGAQVPAAGQPPKAL